MDNKNVSPIRIMSADDLSSTDTRAIKALKKLRDYFLAASVAHLKNAEAFQVKNRCRSGKSRAHILGWAEAYDWAASDVAETLKELGHV